LRNESTLTLVQATLNANGAAPEKAAPYTKRYSM
jgi:hypothetical protein